jgi:two-component system phosphate regulon response regulator PhoB
VSDGTNTTTVSTALLIDDNDDTRRLVRERLLAAGFTVLEAGSGEEGLATLGSSTVDVVVLDVNLPGLDGFAVLRAIRVTSQVPVVLLTASGDETDRVLGLEIGADDYVVKPFSSRELVARVRAVLRRSSPATPNPVLTYGDIVIDTASRVVTVRGEVITLTSRTFDLLSFLSARPGTTFSREELLQQVWKSEPEWQNVATVTEHVHRLRRQIEDNPDSPRHLVTVRGNGYRFDA